LGDVVSGAGGRIQAPARLGSMTMMMMMMIMMTMMMMTTMVYPTARRGE
jgi:hypothetical protein